MFVVTDTLRFLLCADEVLSAPVFLLYLNHNVLYINVATNPVLIAFEMFSSDYTVKFQAWSHYTTEYKHFLK